MPVHSEIMDGIYSNITIYIRPTVHAYTFQPSMFLSRVSGVTDSDSSSCYCMTTNLTGVASASYNQSYQSSPYSSLYPYYFPESHPLPTQYLGD